MISKWLEKAKSGGRGLLCPELMELFRLEKLLGL